MALRIDKRTVDAAEPQQKRFTVWDGDLSGFGLRVEPSGKKSFVYRYRVGAGGRGAPERLIVLGRYGELTPSEARKKAEIEAARVRLGGDPGGERQKERATPTFGAYAKDMLDAAEKVAKAHPEQAPLTIGTIRNYRSYLKVHLAHRIGTKKLDAVTVADCTRIHRDVSEKSPTVANRLMEFIGRTYAAAAVDRHVEKGTNPAAEVTANKEHGAETFMTVPELMHLGECLRIAEVDGIPWAPDPEKKGKHVPKTDQKTRIDPSVAAVIRLLIFTGARLREVLNARWSDLDLERGFLTYFTKTGRRHISLPPPAVAIFSGLPRTSVYCFPAETSTDDDPRPRPDINRPWRSLRAYAGMEHVRLHDLRHSYAAALASSGSSLLMIGKILGHKSPKTTMRYAHLVDDPLRALADRAADTLGAAISGKAPAGAAVTPIRRRGAP